MKFHEYARIHESNLSRKRDFAKYLQLSELDGRESTLHDGRRGILIILSVPLVGH